MAGVTKSVEVFNSREQLLSSDLMRAEFLSSRDDQNILADASTDVTGVPISGFSGPCTLTAASGFAMTLSAAQAFVYNPTDPGLTVDDSPYEIARWALQNLTFGSPGGNDRIDLVVATPAMVNADSQSRNVLVDPVARTIAAQNVFKTSNPQATIAIVAGTPAGTPVPPAVPSGAFALFEVYVPTGGGSSAAFGVVPRMFRRAPFPWTNFSGIVSGFKPKWDLSADPTTTSSTISFGALDDCRVIIDGEYIETLGAILEVFQDGAANPFASPASATWNKPYYLYAVGGRHAPQRGTALGAPVVIVESLTPPFLTTGRPAAAITTPRGSAPVAACVCIGLGSVVANTSFRAACIMDDAFTVRDGPNLLAALSRLSNAFGGAGTAALATDGPAVVPVSSSRAAVSLLAGTGTGTVDAYPDRGDGAAPSPGFSATGFPPLVTASATLIPQRGVLPFVAGAPKFWASASGAGTVVLAIVGFDHGVRRLR